MEYNLPDRQRSVPAWMVEATRRGQLEDEFLVMGFLGWPGLPLMNTGDGKTLEGNADVTYVVLDGPHSEGLIQQSIKYKTRTKTSRTKRNPRVSETRAKSGRGCTLTRRAFGAVDSDFVMPGPAPTGTNHHSHGDVNYSIVGNQTRAELANNMDFGSVRERIEREGGDDREELHNALDQVERLVERGEYLDLGSRCRGSVG